VGREEEREDHHAALGVDRRQGILEVALRFVRRCYGEAHVCDVLVDSVHQCPGLVVAQEAAVGRQDEHAGIRVGDLRLGPHRTGNQNGSGEKRKQETGQSVRDGLCTQGSSRSDGAIQSATALALASKSFITDIGATSSPG